MVGGDVDGRFVRPFVFPATLSPESDDAKGMEAPADEVIRATAIAPMNL